ncbi:MAG: cation diffusion facilitator family transporter [Desulfobulbaceae bacterium]|nr:cation diffusion facilitator family transporter [Desulfobulbaceae bacterium]
METSEKTAWISIAVNLLLVFIKALLAVLSGSLAIRADTIHSMTDVVSSAIILLGIRISRRETHGFPYGLYKVENLVALLTSFLIFYAGYEILIEVFKGPHALPSHIPWAFAGISISILITWLFSRYEYRKGVETGSPSLIADAEHMRTDMLSSLVILAALAGSALGYEVEKYAAVVVVAVIFKAGFSIFYDSVRVLLDASLDSASLEKIRTIVLADPRIMKLNTLSARNAGRYKFVELDLSVKAHELKKGHLITEEIIGRIKQEIPNIDRVLVHGRPVAKHQLTIAVPLAEDKRTISSHLGKAPFFRICSYQRQDNTILSDQILPNPAMHEEKAKGIIAIEWLLEQGLDILVLQHPLSQKGPLLALDKGEATVLVTKETVAEKALSQAQSELSHP